jgi:hypothetical protein
MSTFKAKSECLPEEKASIAPKDEPSTPEGVDRRVLEHARRAFPDGIVNLARVRQFTAEAYARDHVDREPLAGEALKLGLEHLRDSNLLGSWMSAIVKLARGVGSGELPVADALSNFERAARHVKLEIWHRRLFGLEVRPHLPEDKSLSLAISWDRPKTTSLIVDRIWKPAITEETLEKLAKVPNLPVYPGPYVELLRAPDSICFCLGDMFEAVFAGFVVASAYHSLACLAQSSFIAMLGQGAFEGISIPSNERDRLFAFPEQFLSELVGRELGRAAPSLFATVAERDAAYKGGRDIALVSVLQGLPIPVESKLTWEQVLEIRADADSRDRLRRFSRWLDGLLPAKSAAQISDEIFIRLEDYRRALTKHGVETRIGAFEHVVSWQPMLAKFATAVTGSALGEPILGLIGAGSIALGEISIALQKSRLRLQEIHRQHEDVSFVFELNELIRRSDAGDEAE